MTVIRCVHHLRDPDGVEDVRQDGFFRLTGEANLGISRQTLALSTAYRQGCGSMSPKCLHGGKSKGLKLVKLGAHGRGGDPDLNIVSMETSWRHQLASSLNSECFFQAQDAQSCELGRPIFTAVGNLRRFLRDSTV